MTSHTEIKVGAFFLIGLVILAVITFKVENVSALFKKKVVMTAQFPHACGLQAGDTVSVAGLKVGEIRDVRLGDKRVEVIMDIEENGARKIKPSSRATIAWGGLLGNRYVDISLGEPEERPLAPGSEIEISEPIALDEVFRKIDAVATDVQEMLKSADIGPGLGTLVANLAGISDEIREGKGTIGKLIKSDEIYQKVIEISDDVKKTTASLSEEKGTLGKLIHSDELHNKAMGIADDLKEASARVQSFLEKNDERVSSILKQVEDAVPEAQEAFASVKRITEKVEKGEGILPALMDDKQMLDDLKSSLTRLNTSLDRIEDVTKSMKEGKGLIARLTQDEALAEEFSDAVSSLKAVAERVEKGDNTIAKLTRDKDLYDDVKKTVNDARETLRRVKEQIPVGTFTSILLSAF